VAEDLEIFQLGKLKMC